jgi:dCMP deaminase
LTLSASTSPPSRERLPLEKYFVNILSEVAARATCDRGRCGALLTIGGQIIATGYVGSPPGFPHCDDVGHLMVDDHCVRTVHAEQNVLAQAAKLGHSTLGATLYTTMSPCRTCAMLTVTAGIGAVVAVFGYPGDPDEAGPAILREAGVRYRQLSGALATYAQREPEVWCCGGRQHAFVPGPLCQAPDPDHPSQKCGAAKDGTVHYDLDTKLRA